MSSGRTEVVVRSGIGEGVFPIDVEVDARPHGVSCVRRGRMHAGARSMDHVRRLTERPMSISIEPDDKGLMGRECPNAECEGYFKLQFGTGLKGEGLPCHCPYCGHVAAQNHFWTKDQIKHIQSVAGRMFADAAYKDLKKLEFSIPARGSFGIGISATVTRHGTIGIHRYREKALETELICSECSLRYAIYGVFAYCPDCGKHNSYQILAKNIELIEKMLDMVQESGPEISEKLTENCLEDCVSVFDGFGREISRVHAEKAKDVTQAKQLAFQNLEGTRSKVFRLFHIDIKDGLSETQWEFMVRCFQKRNLIGHTMAVVDEDYIRRTGDTSAVPGRKVQVSTEHVRELLALIAVVSQRLSEQLDRLS